MDKKICTEMAFRLYLRGFGVDLAYENPMIDDISKRYAKLWLDLGKLEKEFLKIVEEDIGKSSMDEWRRIYSPLLNNM